MDQFKQYGIISIIVIAFFSGLYGSIELLNWQFFPWLQVVILSLFTFLIGVIQYLHRDRNSQTFIISTLAFIGFEWLISLILFNQPDLLKDNAQLVFLPLIYFVYFALFLLIQKRSEQIQKIGRILFYMLIPSTLSFFLYPSIWSAGGMELLFLAFIGLILFFKPISSEK
ncbi:MAG: hypothetical protein RIS20_1370 [Bacteroidota bacterium]|jgi:hypothetical protein